MSPLAWFMIGACVGFVVGVIFTAAAAVGLVVILEL